MLKLIQSRTPLINVPYNIRQGTDNMTSEFRMKENTLPLLRHWCDISEHKITVDKETDKCHTSDD